MKSTLRTLTIVLVAAATSITLCTTALAESRGKALKRAEKETRAANFDQAEKIYRELLQHDQADKEARLGLSFVLIKQAKLQEGYEEAAQVITADALNARAFALLGTALLTLGTGMIAARHDLRTLLIAGAGLMAVTGLAFPNAEHFIFVAMVAFVGTINPATGDLLWQHPHPTQYDLAVSTPIWGADNILVVSSSYEGGTRALHLSQRGGATTVQVLWHNSRIRVHFGSMIRVGDTVYASSGHDGPAPITAFDVKTGRVLWNTGREFAKAQLIFADGKLIVLDQDGVLALTTPSAQGLTVHSRVQLLERFAWTPPTLVGTRLYVRDRKTIVALDLGQSASAPQRRSD